MVFLTMSSASSSFTTGQDEAMLREELTKLDVKKKNMEHEADAIFLELTTPPGEGVEPMGIETPLVDPDGYPRGDIDVYRCRTLRGRFRELKTDHKEITNKIEALLVQLTEIKVRENGRRGSSHFGLEEGSQTPTFCCIAQDANKHKVIEKEMEQRKRPKPKPKYDPVTGKWVVMNWDGTVAGVPGGEQRNFADIDRQVSALTGDDSSSSWGHSLPSSQVNSTRSTGTHDHEPHPPLVNEGDDSAKKPFARVDAVASRSPAQEAGLVEEDLIITFGPLHAKNNDHLRAIAGMVPDVAEQGGSIEISLLRRKTGNADPPAGHEWTNVTLRLKPHPWEGRGLLGCHIVPYSD